MFRLAVLALLLSATAVFAQNATQQSAVNLPKACLAAAQASGHGEMMQQMRAQMTQAVPSGMEKQMTQTQKGLHAAMMAMNGPMMQGMMAKDADVAWICAMIPHHQGAIDMARAGLLEASDPESRKMAEETIRMQEQEIRKLAAWAEKHAAPETKQTTGSGAK